MQYCYNLSKRKKKMICTNLYQTSPNPWHGSFSYEMCVNGHLLGGMSENRHGCCTTPYSVSAVQFAQVQTFVRYLDPAAE